jgi:Periplasmic protein TonB, links inner and outer membranes
MITILRYRGRATIVNLCILVALAGCAKDTPQKVAQAFQASTAAPDEVPKMLNSDLPFHYPAPLYARKVQGNVTLRLRIDQDGQVHTDSTRIEESSGYPASTPRRCRAPRSCASSPPSCMGNRCR